MAGERLAALGSRSMRGDRCHVGPFVAGFLVLRGCMGLAQYFGIPAAEGQQLCSRFLRLLLGSGPELLLAMQADMGRHPTAAAAPGAHAATSAAEPFCDKAAASTLTRCLTSQAAALWDALHLAAATDWFGEPAAVAGWCPPGKLARWLAAAAQTLQQLGHVRGDLGACIQTCVVSKLGHGPTSHAFFVVQYGMCLPACQPACLPACRLCVWWWWWVCGCRMGGGAEEGLKRGYTLQCRGLKL